MSEHELWNELGNLYFLTGAYDQAILAYNKALQLENNFGKPYSNLALIYFKQKKFDDAISLYKKSLELLSDEHQKAETWNRLGNVYRAQKDYQEAIVAFKNADKLRSALAPDDEQSEPLPYNNSETGQWVYDLQEEQKDYQYNAVEYLHGIELEFDETLQTPVLVEAEVAVENNYYGQDVQMQAATKSVTQSELELLDDISEENMSGLVSNKDAAEEDHLVESEIEPSATPVEQDLSEIDESNLDFEDSELELLDDVAEANMSGMVSKSDVTEEDHLVESEIEPSATPAEQEGLSEIDESNLDIEDSILELQDEIAEENMSGMVSNSDATEEDHSAESEIELSTMPAEQGFSEFVEGNLDFEDVEGESLHNAQVPDEIQETLPDEITPADSEEGIDPDEDVFERDSEYEEPVTQAQKNVESSLVDLSPSVQQTEPEPEISVPETDSEIENSTTLAKDEFDPQIQNDSDPNPSVEKVEQNENDELNGVETDIFVEEKKLARQIEINPRSATTWEALGTLYKTAGRYDEAIQAFEQAISIKPSEVSYFHNLGLVYAAQGNNQEAFNTFQKVLELDPNHSLTHASLGGYYKKIGLDELAQKHIGKAMKHIYESENEYNRACLDAICGNFDQAIKLLRIALENQQTYVDWVLSDPDLDPLRDDERFKQLVADFSN